MRGYTIKQLTLFVILFSSVASKCGRSQWRLQDPTLPEITARWSDGSEKFHLRDHCLEYHAIFCKYDSHDFETHMLPKQAISYRLQPTKTVESAELSRLAENLLDEIKQKKKEYTHFKILKKADFNINLGTGLLIVKYKDYPFVLKLFIKTPQTFVKQNEGIVPKFFFRMGGGTNRHLSGFTRIRNLEKIKERIDKSPKWSKIIDTPRKWYWAPKDIRWITVEGNNIGNKGTCSTTLPAVYGIVVDAVDVERQFSLSSKEDREFGLEFSRYIGNRMDAHVDNLLVEKGSGKIVICDTEHFPTMVGLKEPMEFDSYTSWYLQLSRKCFSDNFFRHKKYRKDMQRHPKPELFTLSTEQESLQLAQAAQKRFLSRRA